jgi:AcrR family transcriptional regulator
MPRVSTRDEILRVSAEQFARSGFKGTSLQDIAAQVGCSKAALLYHFAGKDAILLALVAPAAEALAGLVAHLATLGDAEVQTAAIDGFVDLVLRFRREVTLINQCVPQLLQEPAFEGVRPLTEALCYAFAGRSGSPAAIIAAEVLLSGIASVATEDERAAEALRPALVAVARRALAFPTANDKD